MISLNIATHEKRLNSLEKCVEAILKQRTKPDVVNIYLNDCKAPKWLRDIAKKHDHINLIEGKDLGASAKFYNSESQKKGVYITLDDDLIADPGYVGYLADSAYRYPNAIVGLHGTTYHSHPIKSYYWGEKRVSYFNNGLAADKAVDMLGTGAIAFLSTLQNKPVLQDFEYRNAADPALCKKAKDNKIPMVCLVRSSGFVKEIDGSQDTAIWKGVANNDAKQTNVINSIKDFARQYSKSINTEKYQDASIEWTHLKLIASELSRETNLVEFGSGISTNYLKRFTDNITSFEHDEKYVTEGIDYRPINDGWYGLLKKDLTAISKAKVILIDGPIGSTGERYNFPDSVIDKINKDAIIFVDDCHRKDDLHLAYRIAERMDKEIMFMDGKQKVLARIK